MPILHTRAPVSAPTLGPGDCRGFLFAQKFGQLCDVRRSPARFIFCDGSGADTAEDLDTSHHAQLADEARPRSAGRCQRVDPIALALVEPTKSQR